MGFFAFRLASKVFAGRSIPSAQALETKAVQRRFSAAYETDSLVVFKPDCGIRLHQVKTPVGSVDIELSTRYDQGWGRVQQGIVAVMQGVADSANDLTVAASEPLSDLLSILSFSANAWIGEPAAPSEVQHKTSTQDSRQRDEMRVLDEDATGILIERLGAHPETAKLREVLDCYRAALAHWTLDQQSIALAHLHQGLLTMSEVLIPCIAESRGLARVALAKAYGVRQEELPQRILQTELYRDDTACFQTAQFAWETFRSGQGSIKSDIFAPDDAHFTVGRYLRSSIFRVLELDDACCSVLMNSPYDVPLGLNSEANPNRAERENRSRNLIPVRSHSHQL